MSTSLKNESGDEDGSFLMSTVRKTGSLSNKIYKINAEIKTQKNAQYKRDTDIRGSPSLGYVHKTCQSFLYINPAI